MENKHSQRQSTSTHKYPTGPLSVRKQRTKAFSGPKGTGSQQRGHTILVPTRCSQGQGSQVCLGVLQCETISSTVSAIIQQLKNFGTLSRINNSKQKWNAQLGPVTSQFATN